MTARAGSLPTYPWLEEVSFDTPQLVVDVDVLRRNISQMASLAKAAAVTLRPHVKTHKMREVARMQLEAGAEGIQVAKLGEAEALLEDDQLDVLVGFPLVGQEKLRRLARLAARCRVCVAVDSFEVARAISEVGTASGHPVRLLVELDTGMHRVGTAPGKPAVDLAQRLAELPGVELAGVLTHEGHLYRLTSDVAELERATHAVCVQVSETVRALRARGLAAPVASVGASATARFAMGREGITEVRPGTYVFNDATQVAHGAASIENVAAFVVTTVVSRSRERSECVIDAGSKALSSDPLIVPEPPASSGVVAGRPGWRVTRLSEEHGILSLPQDAHVRIGDQLAIIPNHICPVVNLFDEAAVIKGAEVVDRWAVAGRGRLR